MIKRMIVRVGKRVRKTLPAHKPEFSNVKKICLFKPGAIGDVLMTTPLIRALRRRFPKAKIDYWVEQWSAPVLKHNPHLNRVISFDERHALQKNPFPMLALAERVKRERYDIMFMLDFHYLANLFAAWCRIPVRIGFDREGEGFFNTLNAQYGKRKYDVESYLGLAKLVGAHTDRKIDFFISPEEARFANAFFKKHKLNPKKTIAIAPGGARNPGMDLNIKRWPADRFARVAEALVKKGWQILLIGKGLGDQAAARIVKQKAKAVDATGNIPLRKSAALIAHSAKLICNDSGPMHIAAAVGTPIVAVFGPTDPMKLAPRGPKHRILWKHPKSRPCYLDGKLLPCPDRHQCIKRVLVEDVVKAV